MQLGKLDVSQDHQDHSCKTAASSPQSHQGVASAKQNHPAFPIILAEWDRNAREVVRVALDCYNGRPTINARVWYRADDGLQPSKSGITLTIKHLPALAEALAKAERHARELGLIEEARTA